jgi:thiosulfate reductase/polysulfide reductase chain A
LPECTYLERWDSLNAPAFRRPFVALRAPAVPARFESRSAFDIAHDLGHKLGLRAWFPFASQEDELREQAKASGLDWETLLRDGVIAESVDGGMTETPSFDTPTKKIELWSAQLAKAGFDPVPLFYEIEAPPAGFVRLIYGRSPVHSFGRTQNNRYLAGLVPENAAWISPGTAAAWGVANGGRVMLENQDGAKTGPIAVKVTERVRDDVLYMVNGFGHENPGMRLAYRRGGADSELITRYATDPLMGGTGMRVNFVRVAREA